MMWSCNRRNLNGFLYWKECVALKNAFFPLGNKARGFSSFYYFFLPIFVYHSKDRESSVKERRQDVSSDFHLAKPNAMKKVMH